MELWHASRGLGPVYADHKTCSGAALRESFFGDKIKRNRLSMEKNFFLERSESTEQTQVKNKKNNTTRHWRLTATR